MTKKLRIRVEDFWYDVEVEDLSANPIIVRVDGDTVEVHFDEVAGNGASGSLKDTSDPSSKPSAERTATVRGFRSPMPEGVLEVPVKEGDQVVTGDEVCVIEAMKMRQSLRADWSGLVKSIYVKPGQHIMAGDLIMEIES